jgi:hypothetical protein
MYVSRVRYDWEHTAHIICAVANVMRASHQPPLLPQDLLPWLRDMQHTEVEIKDIKELKSWLGL